MASRQSLFREIRAFKAISLLSAIFSSFIFIFLLPDISSVKARVPDVNKNGKVEVGDLILLTLKFNSSTGELEPADVNEDGIVDVYDLVIVGRNYNSVCICSPLRNPSWEELLSFLKEDDTEKLIYDPGVFDCTGFAITLRDRALWRGWRSAFVEITFGGGGAHALVAFKTEDLGLVFVDDTGDEKGTGRDKIAYIKPGKPYGLISLEGVKTTYIACEGEPEEFWRPLTYASCENPFDYGYYEEWRRRYEFYLESVEAYNRAVEEYNRGEGEYTYSQLESWRENLLALEENLGPAYAPMGIVQNIEMYWN